MDKLNELMRNNGGYITAKQAKEAGRYVYYRLLEKVQEWFCNTGSTWGVCRYIGIGEYND